MKKLNTKICLKNISMYIAAAFGLAAFGGMYFAAAGSFVTLVCAFAAPTLFLYASRQCSSKRERIIVGAAFATGLVFMNLGYAPSVLLDIVAFGVSAVYISFAFVFDAGYAGADRKFLSTLIFPAVWVSLFHLAGLAYVGFQFRLDAFVTSLKAFTQLESIIGSIGVLFLILWTASVIVYIIEKGRKISSAGVIIWAGIMIFSILFGAFRMRIGGSNDGIIRAAYTAGPYVGDFMNYEDPGYDVYTKSLEKSVAEAADYGAELLMFTEEAFCFSDTQEEDFTSLISALADKHDLYILSGEDVYYTEQENKKNDNRISLYGPDGELIFRYSKHSLVPLIETVEYARGEAVLPSAELNFKCGTIKVASSICYDSNFSSYISTIPDDVQLLLMPSWDWGPVSDYHGEVAREVAIENGVTVLKATYDGISYLFTPTGETIYSSDTAETGFEAVHFIFIPVQARDTVYSCIGPYFSWAITVATALAVGILEARKKRKDSKPAASETAL